MNLPCRALDGGTFCVPQMMIISHETLVAGLEVRLHLSTRSRVEPWGSRNASSDVGSCAKRCQNLSVSWAAALYVNPDFWFVITIKGSKITDLEADLHKPG